MPDSTYLSSDCPEHLELIALAEGTLTSEQADQVAVHVAHCHACEARLERIEEQSDWLVRALAAQPPSADDEETLRRVQADLLAHPEPFQSTAETDATLVLKNEVPLQLVLPIQLGNYELLEQIGAGAHGAVFRARHRRLEREVAVKLLLHASQPFVEEFLNEMRIIGQLDHPNIIRATDAGEHDGTYFLVMDFVSGLDVSSLLLRSGPLGIANACEIARQTALGLAFAHQHQLVHRDVKTSNLLFTSGGQIKLLDLGLATITSRIDGPPSSHPRSGPRGTADYMAPEQWVEASTVSPQADLYSLGCTLFKLLTGEPPFHLLPPGVHSKQQAHTESTAPALSAYRNDVPGNLEALVSELLAKSPSARPATAEDVADRLGAFATAANLALLAEQFCPELEPAPEGLQGTSPPRRRAVHRRTILVTAAMVCGAIALTIQTFLPEPRVEINTDSWRTLSPVAPELLAIADGAQPSIEEAEQGLTLVSSNTALLHFGSPLRTPFRWTTELSRDAWHNSAGIFFRLRKDSTGGLNFHSLQFHRIDTDEGLVLWSSHGGPEPPEAHQVLGETSLRVPAGQTITFDIVIGSAGFPSISVNGAPLAQSQWTLATEAREFVVANVDKLAELYAGRIGVLQHAGKTNVVSSRLKYLD